MDLDGVDPVELGVALSKLPPDHPLVIAARDAAEISEGRRATTEASKDVAEGWKGDGGVTNARQMWEGRAETDGPDSSAAAKAKELETPMANTYPNQCLVDPNTERAVRWAREWAAERAALEAADTRRAEEACARHAAEAARRDAERNTDRHTQDEHVRELTDVR